MVTGATALPRNVRVAAVPHVSLTLDCTPCRTVKPKDSPLCSEVSYFHLSIFKTGEHTGEHTKAYFWHLRKLIGTVVCQTSVHSKSFTSLQKRLDDLFRYSERWKSFLD
jgi:hypothetical protein